MKHNLTNMIKRKWSAAVLLCAMIAVSNEAWGAYGICGSSCLGLNSGSLTTMTNNSYSFTASCSGSQWFKLYDGSISDANSCKLGSLSSNSTISTGTSYAITKPGSTYQYNISLTSGTSYTFTISNGSLTVTSGCSATAPTITTTSTASDITTGGATLSGNVTAKGQTAACGTQTLSARGVKVWSDSGCSTLVGTFNHATANATGAYSVSATGLSANTTYYYKAYATNPAGTSYGSKYSFTTATASVPTMRIGAKPTISASDCSMTVNTYVAQTGCAALTGITLYYSNNRAFRTDGSYKTQSKTVTSSLPAAAGGSKSFSLTSGDVGAVVKPGETIYLRCTASNASGTSAYSDIVPVQYVCGKFVKQNLNKSFKACPGEHQFTWGDMFISPTPATWSCTLGGSDATSDFTLKDGEMIWNTEGKTATSYTYTFTAKKDGYDDATATLTITYTVPGSISGSISGVTASAASTTPWTAVTLTAAGTKGNMTKIYWTSAPESAEITPSSATLSSLPATAKFKAEATGYSVDYTVTATGYTADCASSSKSVTIKVTPDVTEKCD